MARVASFLGLSVVLVLCAGSAGGQTPTAFGSSDLATMQIQGLTQGETGQIRTLFDQAGISVLDDGTLQEERGDLVQVLRMLQQAGKLPPDFQLTEIGLGKFLASPDDVTRTFEPQEGAAYAASRIQWIKTHCQTAGNGVPAAIASCREKEGLEQYEQMRWSLLAAAGPCDLAAENYFEIRSGCLDAGCTTGESNAAFKAFDDECLHAMVPWRHADGLVRADAMPVVFSQGGSNAGVQGALNALAHVEVLDGGKWTHWCGGLLLSGNRLLTARHCFDTTFVRSRLKEGKVRARLLRGAEDVWPLKWIPDVDSYYFNVADDRIVLPIDAPTAIPAPKIVFDTPKVPTETVVAGHFYDFDRGRERDDPLSVAGVSPRPLWQRALRWARPGMCYAVQASSGCVRILCQTVPGYSGTPVIAASSGGPDAPIVVYGIISRADLGNQSQCGTSAMVATLAASAVGINP